jgi:CDP-glycerol glycerophosphotransferase (TagB/SpsB family)
LLNKIIKWLPFFLLYLPFKIYALISREKRKILLFGTGTGLYHDNSKYLFEYFLENKANYPEFKAYWVATNKDTYNKLHDKGIPVIYRNSVLCAKYAARAKAYFVTAGLIDVFWFIDKNTLLIQLWHGVPIKKI